MQIAIAIRITVAAVALAAAPASAQTGTGESDSTAVGPSIAPRDDSVTVTRAGSQPSQPGPAEWFTGRVRIDPVFAAPAPARAAGATVTFEPGARTAWHTHPLGQTLIVLSGLGRVQREGGPVEEIRPGDVVSIPAGARHWHGASPATAMTHIAIQESLEGRAVECLSTFPTTSTRRRRVHPEMVRTR